MASFNRRTSISYLHNDIASFYDDNDKFWEWHAMVRQNVAGASVQI